MNGMIEITEGYIDWSEESDVIGYSEEDNEITESYIRINNLFVNPENRGNGIARQLMTSAIEIIRKQSALAIKIVPEPKDSATNLEKLANFYSEFPVTVVAI